MDTVKNNGPIRAGDIEWPATEKQVNVYRYGLFKGMKDGNGKVVKVRSVGTASIREGLKTYILELRALTGQRYYLLPSDKKRDNGASHLIFTREEPRRPDRKYFWTIVGEAWALKDDNDGLMLLKWDLFGEEVYMDMKPYKVIPTSDPVFQSA